MHLGAQDASQAPAALPFLVSSPIAIVVGGGGDMVTLVAIGPLVVVAAFGPSFDIVALPVAYLIVYKLYIH